MRSLFQIIEEQGTELAAFLGIFLHDAHTGGAIRKQARAIVIGHREQKYINTCLRSIDGNFCHFNGIVFAAQVLPFER